MIFKKWFSFEFSTFRKLKKIIIVIKAEFELSISKLPPLLNSANSLNPMNNAVRNTADKQMVFHPYIRSICIITHTHTRARTHTSKQHFLFLDLRSPSLKNIKPLTNRQKQKNFNWRCNNELHVIIDPSIFVYLYTYEGMCAWARTRYNLLKYIYRETEVAA